ncbi:MAG: rod shape-determining protein MreC [Magnetovibrionaceae bacterium]
MKEQSRTIGRVAQPVRNLLVRFAYVGLVISAFSLMMLGKADLVLVERVRSQVTDAVAPILDVIARPVATISDWIDTADQLARIRAENERLMLENARLKQWQSAAHKLQLDNQKMQELLRFQVDPSLKFVSGRVIADTGGAFAESVLLNVGGRAGVLKGQAVINGAGLVGRVQNVGGRSSRVLLVTDLNSRIPVVLQNGRVRAIMAGDNQNLPRLMRMPPGTQIRPGDRVTTSGHGGAFPPGLPVGVVAEVAEGGLVRVQPFMDRHRLELVRVVEFGLSGILREDGFESGLKAKAD